MALRKVRLPSGTERWQASYATKDGRRHARNFARKKDGEAWLASVRVEVMNGTHIPASASPTVAEACADYRRHLEGRHARGEHMQTGSLKVDVSRIDNHLLPAEHGLADVKLVELTGGGIARWRDRLRDGGMSVTTTRRCIALLARVIDHAIASDKARVNPARSVKVIGTTAEDREVVVAPSKASVRAAIAAAGQIDDTLGLILTFAAQTGVRASEIWALRWKHLDLSAGSVSVEERVDAWREVSHTKSKAGRRVIPLSSALTQVLRVFKLKSGGIADALVFPNRKGCFRSHTNFCKREMPSIMEATMAAVEDEGQPVEAFTFHQLRHYAVSLWIEAGLAPKVVQGLAGHSTLELTMSRYGHWFPSPDHKGIMDQIAAHNFA